MTGYNYDTVRVTCFGDMLAGQEEWSTGFFMGKPDAAAVIPTQGAADAISAAWATFFATGSAGISNTYRSLGIKMAWFPSGNDHSDPDKTIYSYHATPILGGNTGGSYPPQIALVASLDATPNRGLAGKGRMYLPGVNHAFDTTGAISSANRLATANALKTFFDTINASTTVSNDVINASKGRIGVPFANAISRKVTAVRVGSVYDTQRRRRNNLPEVYSTVAIV
jgi:hypothetical protein